MKRETEREASSRNEAASDRSEDTEAGRRRIARAKVLALVPNPYVNWWIGP